MKQKIIIVAAALTALSACGVMRDTMRVKAREGLFHANNDGSMQPIKMGSEYLMPPLQELPIGRNVTKGTLPNGMTYYIYKTTRDGYENSANFQLIQKTGSLVEDDDQLGVAHFVEHYAYNWTKNFPNCAAPDYIKKIGGNCNASTSYDYTEYHTDIVPLKGNGQIIDSCLLILRDIAANCDFESDFIDRERKIILEEYRLRNSLTINKLYANIFKGMRYADRSPIGTLENIQQMQLQKLKDYYNKWYQPQNQAVVVFGNVNASEIESKIAKTFGDIPRGNSEIPRFEYVRTKHDTPDAMTFQDDKSAKGTLNIVFSTPDKPLVRQRNTTAYWIGRDTRWRIKSLLEERLKRIQLETMLFDDFEIMVDGFCNIYDDVQFAIHIEFAPDNWQKVAAVVSKELEKIRRYGWTKKEINSNFHNLDSTKSLKDSVNFTKGDDIGYHSSRCHLMDFYLANFVYGDYLIDSKQVGSLYDYRHGRIDAGMGHDYFMKMTADSNTAVILSLPWDANRDELLDVYLSARNDADDNNKFQYAEDADYYKFITELKLEDVQPGKTVAKRKIELFDATEFTFDNGVKAVVCKKNCSKNFFQIKGIRPGALTNFSDEDAQKIKILNDVISTPYMDINDERIHSKHSVSDYCDMNSIYAMPTSISPEAFIRYMHYRLTNTEIDSMRLENCKLKYIADSKTEQPLLSRRNSLFETTLHGDAYTKRIAPLSPQVIEKITTKEMRDLCKKYYGNFNGATFIIYSEYSPEYLKPILEKYLGSLPSLPQPLQYADIEASRFINCNDTAHYHYESEEPRSDIMVNYVLKDNFQYSQNLHIVSDAFVNILNDLMFNNIRQSDGKVYGVYANCLFEGKPQEAQVIFASSTCLPQNARPILDSVQSIISQMAYGNLITERQVKIYIDNKLKYIDLITQKPRSLFENETMNILTDYYLNNCTDRRITSAKLVRSLTVEKIRAFAKDLITNGIRHEMIIDGE